MWLVRRMPQQLLVLAGALLLLATTGCGGSGAMRAPAMNPITASLSSPTVLVKQDGTPSYVQINIMSPSETALVILAGLPGGVEFSYSASDTNPSGLLTFTAKSKVVAGTYMPTITVNSAGQTATLTFTLVVPAK